MNRPASYLTIIEGIDKELRKYYELNNQWSLNYKIGYIVFLSYFSKYKNKKDYSEIYKLIDVCIDHINSQGKPDLSLFRGLAGFGWMLQHLNKIGILNQRDIKILTDVDDLINYDLEINPENSRDYDLLYGLIGKAIYFLSRKKTLKIKIGLANIFEIISSMRIEDATHIFWKKSNSVDMGIAHGIPSIITFYRKLYDFEPYAQVCLKYLKKISDFILSNQIQSNNTCYFSVKSGSNDISRLGWCYGDLSVAIGLAHANQILRSPKVKDVLKKIVLKSSTRDISMSGVFYDKKNIDAGLCHGSLGIAYIQQKLSRLVDLEKNDLVVKYWLHKTFEKIDLKSHFLNFKTAYPEGESLNWGYDGGLVDGLSGIGLMLISMERKELSDWDSLFLLDIEQ